MNIGIIGSGNIGATAARCFAEAGHSVAISNSRGPESLRELVARIRQDVHATTVEEAAGFGEVALVAIPFFAYETLPADHLTGQVVVDATNYYEGRDSQMDFGGLSSSELIARKLPGARVVKAFNTMYYETLGAEGQPSAPVEERLVLFVAGNDEEAKAIVSHLIEEIGFAPVDTGSLRDGGRKQQPGSPIYNTPMTPEQARETLAGMG
ncbi:MAG: NAD(P)-binding domain-containing protein [Actinobacteria bacterium]|nr:NAD(P)-binding domain-containing protein [Actinomycetota bacterium]